MTNRRRSERFEIALPVWLKDARGGERTTTVDVSAHGISVLATHERPLRQYVELEMELDVPQATITVTAVVARHADLVHSETGERMAGLGLDFFLFDAQAKALWQQFIAGLGTRAPKAKPQPAVSRPPPLPPPDVPEEDETPTFIIKPRDLGRLWAFFRGEMARRVVRIETPVLKPVGHPAELLVVHPTSQAEWALEGHVVTATANGRGGRPVLEIGLDSLIPEVKSAFRNFVATGRGQVEEDVEISLDTDDDMGAAAQLAASAGPPAREDPEPERIESVVIDLDSLDAFETPLGSGLIEARAPGHHTGSETPSGLVPRAPEAEIEDDDPTQHTGSPLPPGFVPEPPAAPRPAIDPDPPAAPPRPADSAERPTSVFASFFDEARAAEPELIDDDDPSDRVGFDHPETTDEAEVDLSAASRARSQVGRVVPVEEDEPPASEPIPLVHRIDRSRKSPPPLPAAKPPPLPSSAAPPPVPPPTPAEPSPAPRRAAPPLPPSARMRRASSAAPRRRPRDENNPSVQVVPVTPSPNPEGAIPVVAGRPASDQAAPDRPESITPDYMAQNPPVPPGSVFDFGEASRRISVSGPAPEAPAPAPAPAPSAADRPAPAARGKRELRAIPTPRGRTGARQTEEPQDRVTHRSLSTESTNPGLARDIALARARVVRSPHSVTACYRLSTLLLQNSDEGGFDEAVRALEKVMALEPNHPGAHHKLAELHARQGNYKQAADHLSRARRLGYQVDPDLEHIISEATRS